MRIVPDTISGVALSGDPRDIFKTDAKVKELIPDDKALHHWLDGEGAHQLPWLAGAHLLGGVGVARQAGLAFNEMVRNGELQAPVVIGRDHLDSGSVASPNRETEAMKDGSDAESDGPLLNAMLNVAGGAIGCRCIMAVGWGGDGVFRSIRAW